MQTLIFATNNQHKVEEIRSVLKDQFKIITLAEAGIDQDITEPYDTIEANALEKARVIYALTGRNCFGEDTGLEVEALNGEPGVKSARYAGEEKSFENNTRKLLQNMQDKENRKAQFKTIIALILNGKEYLFEGICKGCIDTTPRGDKGFGYDPIFIPEGQTKTFAEMNMDEKNIYSHRRKAMDKLITFLSDFFR